MKRIIAHLKENWIKYGFETLVVTVGILAAFLLNNWNEKRKDRIQEDMVLIGLREEFNQNIKELNSDHSYNILSLAATEELLKIDGSSENKQRIDSLIGISMNWATFDPRVGVINEVITSGKLGLILDERLRYLLTQWSGELEDLREDIIIRREHWQHHLNPEIAKYIPLRNIDRTSVRADYQRKFVINPLDYNQSKYDELLMSSTFDGALYSHFLNQTFVVINEESIEKFMLEVLAIIEQSIKK